MSVAAATSLKSIVKSDIGEQKGSGTLGAGSVALWCERTLSGFRQHRCKQCWMQ